jgi:hypothetical protein
MEIVYMKCDFYHCESKILDEEAYDSGWKYLQGYGDLCPKHYGPSILQNRSVQLTGLRLFPHVEKVYSKHVEEQIRATFGFKALVDKHIPKDKVFVFLKETGHED